MQFIDSLRDIWEAIVNRILYWLRIPEEKVCQNCEYLKLIIEQNRLERVQLQELLRTPITKLEEYENRTFEPIAPKYTPWNVKRAQLEKNDREEAARLRKESENKIQRDRLQGSTSTIEELEKELEIAN